MVTVYTNENCMPCKMTKKWLSSNGIPYEEKQVSDLSDKELNEYKEMGCSSAPIVVVEWGVWSGYRLDKLRKLKEA